MESALWIWLIGAPFVLAVIDLIATPKSNARTA
jgi:hypothetical protein